MSRSKWCIMSKLTDEVFTNCPSVLQKRVNLLIISIHGEISTLFVQKLNFIARIEPERLQQLFNLIAI